MLDHRIFQSSNGHHKLLDSNEHYSLAIRITNFNTARNAASPVSNMRKISSTECWEAREREGLQKHCWQCLRHLFDVRTLFHGRSERSNFQKILPPNDRCIFTVDAPRYRLRVLVSFRLFDRLDKCARNILWDVIHNVTFTLEFITPFFFYNISRIACWASETA